MIQRIQSLFLLLSGLLLFIMFLMPLAVLVNAEGETIEFWYRGFLSNGGEREAVHNFSVAILLLITMIISVGSIFLFKKRILQIRVSVFNILLMIGLLILMYFSLQSFTKTWDAIIQYKLTMVFPVVSAVLTFLAIRAIGKDEALIRSMNRIR